jgi:EpsI family protein
MQSLATRLVVACVLLAAGTAGVAVARVHKGAPVRFVFDAGAVPLSAAGYSGTDVPQASQIMQYLEAQAAVSRIYRREGAKPVRLTVVYSTDWRSIHSPTGCYPAQGWNVERDDEVALPAPPGNSQAEPLQARAVVATKEGHAEQALFLYAYPGGTTSDWTREGWMVATGRTGAGGLVIILTTEAVGAKTDEARGNLAALLSELYEPTVSFWGSGSGDGTSAGGAGR